MVGISNRHALGRLDSRFLILAGKENPRKADSLSGVFYCLEIFSLLALLTTTLFTFTGHANHLLSERLLQLRSSIIRDKGLSFLNFLRVVSAPVAPSCRIASLTAAFHPVEVPVLRYSSASLSIASPSPVPLRI